LGTRAGSREELAIRLAAFEAVLVAAEPHVPPRLADELATVVRNVQIGRWTTVGTPGAPVVSSELLAGVDALFNVSDLVGTACGSPIYDEITLTSR
jgi:hypothetical protein